MKQSPIYTLPHGIEVIGEYPVRGPNRYVRVRIRPHRFFPETKQVAGGCYVRRSRAVMASKLGRALLVTENVHHRDEDRTNDHPDNLELIGSAEHNRHHKTGKSHRPESRARTSSTIKTLYASGTMVPHSCLGSANASAKLTEAQASTIKHSTERTGVLVARYGVSRTVIKQIRNGKIWRHIA